MDDTERLQQRKQEALQIVDFLGRVLSLMMRLAAPRMLARVPPEGVARSQVLQHVDDYLVMVAKCEASQPADNDDQFGRSGESTRRVRALLETWSFTGEAPSELVQAARDFHTAFIGRPFEPPGGWDAYEGPDE